MRWTKIPIPYRHATESPVYPQAELTRPPRPEQTGATKAGRTKMKLRKIALRLGLGLAGAIALGGVAFAQNVPEQFVVSGKAAEKIQDFSTINVATAQRIAESCEKA